MLDRTAYRVVVPDVRGDRCRSQFHGSTYNCLISFMLVPTATVGKDERQLCVDVARVRPHGPDARLQVYLSSDVTLVSGLVVVMGGQCFEAHSLLFYACVFDIMICLCV